MKESAWDKLVDAIITAIDERIKKPTTSYSDKAQVLKVDKDRGIAWVHIPGGEPETPAKLTIDAKAGDIVQVSVSNHKATLTGNMSAPPTDDTVAKEADEKATKNKKKIIALEDQTDLIHKEAAEAQEAADNAMTAANGKNTIYRQPDEPTGGDYKVGDTWFDTDDDNKIYHWNGTQWSPSLLGDDALDYFSANHLNAGTIDASQVTVSNLDAGNITTGYLNADRIQAGSLSISKISNLQNELNGKADDDDAVLEQQYVYISKVSGTSSVNAPSSWISETGDVQNSWSIKRPTYSSSYPVVFVSKQMKKVDGTVTSTTPIKDDTTTVIDGGHITTGTIDAARLNINDIIASGSIIVAGDNISDLVNDSGFVTSDGIILRNLVKTGFWSPNFADNLSGTGWTKESSATMEYDDSTGLWKISCSSSYYGLTQQITLEPNTDYILSCEAGTTFNLGFGTSQYSQYSGSWTTADDGRKYRKVTTGSGTTYYVYPYATSSVPCYINRIKIEKGDTYTGWAAGADEIEFASGVAGNYLTNISGYNGICIHDAGDLQNFAQFNSDGMTVYVGGTSYAQFGSKAILGKVGSTSYHAEINQGEMGFFYGTTKYAVLEFFAPRGLELKYKNGAGVNVSLTETTVTGDANITGDLTAGNIDCGETSITPTADTPTKKSITFNKTFSAAPIVVACFKGTVPGTTVKGVSVHNISTTGCDIYVTRSNTNSTAIEWIAIGE